MNYSWVPDWKSLGDERIPRFPSKIGEKREITVTITSWTTVGSIGAKHWDVEVQEQNNSWWSEDSNQWQEVACDSGKHGYSLKAAVLSKAEAVRLAVLFVRMIGGNALKNHDVVWHGEGRPKWAL